MRRVNKKIQDINNKHSEWNNKTSKCKNQKTTCLCKSAEVFHPLIIMKFLNQTYFQTLTSNPTQQIWWTVLLSTFHKTQIKHLFIKGKVMFASFCNNRLINKKFQFKLWILKGSPKSRLILKTVQVPLKFSLTCPKIILIIIQPKMFQKHAV